MRGVQLSNKDWDDDDGFRPMCCKGWECQCQIGSPSVWIDRLLLLVALAGTVLVSTWLSVVIPSRVYYIRQEDVTTAVRMRYAKELPFPAITICNMARTVPLDPVYCGTYTNTSLCFPQKARDGLSNCVSVNNDLNQTVYTTSKTGLADTLLVALRLNTDQYPVSERFSGVHVSLHPRCSHAKGECPEELSSVLVASPGRPRFYRMRRVSYVFLNGTQETQYEAQHGDAGAFYFRSQFGPEQDTVVLGFHYSSLAETSIQELRPYTWLDLGAEMGGILGLIFGIGVVPIFADVVQWLARRQSLYYRLTGRRARDAVRGVDVGTDDGDWPGGGSDSGHGSGYYNGTGGGDGAGWAGKGVAGREYGSGGRSEGDGAFDDAEHSIGLGGWYQAYQRRVGGSKLGGYKRRRTSIRGPCAPLRVVLGIVCGCSPLPSAPQGSRGDEAWSRDRGWGGSDAGWHSHDTAAGYYAHSASRGAPAGAPPGSGHGLGVTLHQPLLDAGEGTELGVDSKDGPTHRRGRAAQAGQGSPGLGLRGEGEETSGTLPTDVVRYHEPAHELHEEVLHEQQQWAQCEGWYCGCMPGASEKWVLTTEGNSWYQMLCCLQLRVRRAVLDPNKRVGSQ